MSASRPAPETLAPALAAKASMRGLNGPLQTLDEIRAGRIARAAAAAAGLPNGVGNAKQELAERHVAELMKSYTALAGMTDLEPSAVVNGHFERLVGVAVLILEEDVAQRIVTHPRILPIATHLRQIASVGESKLEALWSTKIANPQTCRPWDLTYFPYYSNYIDLTRLELAMISTVQSNPRKFAFLGCGPLPMTSFCILEQLAPRVLSPTADSASIFSSHSGSSSTSSTRAATQISVLNVDSNPSAIAQATMLSCHLGFSGEAMRFCCDVAGGRKHDISTMDVVILAALVGQTGAEKKRILMEVVRRMKEGSVLVLRSAWGLRTLLYPEIRIPQDVDIPGLEIMTVAHPHNNVVNSVIVGRVSRNST